MSSEQAENQDEPSAGDEFILRIIQRCADAKDKMLDLSNKRISDFPESILKLNHLQFLYMEGNRLKALPGNFFDCLHDLKWLDLRNNCLVTLPSAYIGRHTALQTLLLEGNRLETLPLELGLVSSLEGLNIANNPLKFPPEDVIRKGAKEVLRFCRGLLHMKSVGHSEMSLTDGTSVEHIADASAEFHDTGRLMAAEAIVGRPRPGTASSVASEVMGQAAALHLQGSYSDLKLATANRLRKTGSSAAEKKQTRQLNSDAGTLPSDEQIDQKLVEQSKKSRDKSRKENVEKLLQKVKNAEALSEFRDKARNLQRKKDAEKRIKGKLDYVEAMDGAPFDVDPDHARMISNEERIKDGVRKSHERVRRVLSPSAIRRLEEARVEKEKELHDKLKQHTQSMKERRQKPKGTPQEEMDSAIRELEIAKRLQRELDRRRKELEYRFKTFGSDTPTAAPGKRNK